MSEAETAIQMCERHVQEGQKIVRAQQSLVAVMKRKGGNLEEAKRLLRTFEGLQLLHEQHLQRLRHEDV